MPKRKIVVVPDGDVLNNPLRWQKSGKDGHLAVRHFILIVESTSDKRKHGPAFSTFGWPAGAKLNLEKKRVRTTKSTDQLVRGIEATVSAKLSREITSSIGSVATLNADALGATLSAGISARTATEFTDSLTSNVTGTTTFEIAQTEEDKQGLEHVMPDQVPSGPVTLVNKYHMVRAVHWDIFLVRSELLALRYRRNSIGAKTREKIREWSEETYRPIGRVTFYQPESDYGVRYGDYTPEISEDALIEVTEPIASAPKHVTLPDVTPLATHARKAFPTTPEWAKDVVRKVVRSARKAPASRTAGAEGLRRRQGVKKAANKKASGSKTAAPKAGGRSAPMRAGGSSQRHKTATRKQASAKRAAPKGGTSSRGSAKRSGSSRGR